MTIGGGLPSDDNASKGNQNLKEPEPTVKFMYAVACFANLIINVDHGIMPACTPELQADLGLDGSKLGLIMSVVYIGLMLGSVLSGPLLSSYSCKKIIATSIAGNILALTIFPFTSNFFLLCLSRILVGFCQVFCVIYFPVWVDVFGGNKKTLWITYLQLGVALGIFFGYGLTAFFVQYFNWRGSFYLLIVLLTPCLAAFCLFKEEYMQTSTSTIQSHDETAEEKQEKFLLTISHSGSFFETEIREYVLGNEKKGANANELDIAEEEDEITDKLGYFDYLKILWTKKVYIYTMLACTDLYFVINGVQAWISDYMRIVLGVEKSLVFLAFGIISITGPTTGVLIGGNILDKIGGYTGKHAINFCLGCGVCASLFGVPIPFLNNFLMTCVLLWFVLFFGGALMPAVIGMMLSSIPKKIRAIGYSSAQIIQNLFGYFPAPVLYGSVVQLTGGKDSRYGMVMLMTWSSLGVFCLIAAKNARSEKHANYMKAQYVEIPDEEASRPDLFQPKPKLMELTEFSPDHRRHLEDDVRYEGGDSTRKATKYKTFGEATFDLLTRKKSVSRLGKIEEELQALNKATVDYRYLRKKSTSILSKDNLGNFNMMFGRPTIDKQNEKIHEELL